MQHLLPRGLHRIRRSEVLAPRRRKERLAQARAALGAPPLPAPAEEPEEGDDELGLTERFYLERGVDLSRCPHPDCPGRVWRRKLGRRTVPLGQLHIPQTALWEFEW